VPPFVGVAVNVTLWPEHTVVAEADILTDGVTLEFTVIVIEFEVAGLPVTPLRLEVITQVTASEPAVRLVVV
jgi:hypothetical protein